MVKATCCRPPPSGTSRLERTRHRVAQRILAATARPELHNGIIDATVTTAVGAAIDIAAPVVMIKMSNIVILTGSILGYGLMKNLRLMRNTQVLMPAQQIHGLAGYIGRLKL